MKIDFFIFQKLSFKVLFLSTAEKNMEISNLKMQKSIGSLKSKKFASRFKFLWRERREKREEKRKKNSLKL